MIRNLIIYLITFISAVRLSAAPAAFAVEPVSPVSVIDAVEAVVATPVAAGDSAEGMRRPALIASDATDAIAYQSPGCRLFWGAICKEGLDLFPYSIMQLPVNTPLTWNAVNLPDNSICEWSCLRADGDFFAFGNEDDFSLTFAPDYTTDFTKRNNLYSMPELKVITNDGTDTDEIEYSQPYLFLQSGGKAEFISIDGWKEYGLLPFDGHTRNVVYALVPNPETGVNDTSLFGYSAGSSGWWTQRVFGLNPEPEQKAEITGFANIIMAPDQPLVVESLWLNARGIISGEGVLTATIYGSADEDGLEWVPVAEAQCPTADIITLISSRYDYLTIPFDFDSPIVVSSDQYPSYMIEITGFNDGSFDFLAPLQAGQPDPDGICHGHVRCQSQNGDKLETTLVPMSEFKNQYGPMISAFAINIGGYYPWMECLADDHEVLGRQPRYFNFDTYFDASQIKVTMANGDELPSWIKVTPIGRYNEAALCFERVEPGRRFRFDIKFQAPGFEHSIQLTVRAMAGVDSVSADAGEEEGTLYDLSGRRVSGQPNKGIYINAGGKKISINR